MQSQFKKKFSLLFLIAFLLCGLLGHAQQRKDPGGNLPKFYRQKLHFGFMIGVNRSNFLIHSIPNSQLYSNFTDSLRYPKDTLNLKSITSKPEYGFSLQIIGDVRLHEYIRIRCLPGLSFGSRNLNYYFTGTDTFTVTKRVESTYIVVPINIKLQSKRLGNFSAFVLGGGSYSVDLAYSKRQKSSDDVVRLKQHDFYWEAGAGVDFYLTYFKLAFELKMVNGIKNILLKDETIFTRPIDKLNSRIIQFSVTFEG
jgi:hypothetical protein